MIRIERHFSVRIEGLFLVCDKHKDNPRWKGASNHWGILDPVRLLLRGYRRVRIMSHASLNQEYPRGFYS